MRIALLAPLPPEQTGIADYAAHFSAALRTEGIEVATPLEGCGLDFACIDKRMASFDWHQVDLVHAELGGGRLGEFRALCWLRDCHPNLPLTATAHDPERLVWRRARLPWPLHLLASLPHPLPQLAALLADPLTLSEERRLARHINRFVTLTECGGRALSKRMNLTSSQLTVIPHGNLLQVAPLPPLSPIRLLYFGFIYRGKGIEDIFDALALVFKRQPELRNSLRLTLAGGTSPEIAFSPSGNYLHELQQRAHYLNLDGLLDWQLDVPAANIAGIIQAHHVMLLPYKESKKLSLLGQMRGTSGALSWSNACGRGVITSNARAFAEEVAKGNGDTYAQGNITALATCIERVATQPQLAQQWADCAARIARERAWPVTAQRFQQLFTSITGAHNAMAQP